MKRQARMSIFALSLALLCPVPRLEAQNSFIFLQSGFTQTLFGNAPAFFGGVAFAPNKDVWVDHCFFSGAPLTRFVFGTTTPDGHGGLEHPEAAGSPFASNAGCGLTNHPDGTLYSNTSLGVVNLDANTGAQLRPAFGPPGNALGITVDPQTNNIVYVESDCRFTPTCTIVSIDPVSLVSSNFAVLPSSEAEFEDGIFFDPSGNFLFLSNRAPVFRMTILDRSGTVVQNVAMTSEPDGIAFHVNPTFVVTNNTDGTMTRFDFPSNNFTLPPTQTVFASGGFRGDLSQVGADDCLYVTQNGTRFDDNTTSANDSIVRICPNFVPPPGVAAHVFVDIKPQSCPNPINVGGVGVLPVAVLGTATFDVTTIDPSSLKLQGVPALRSALEDLATPFTGPLVGATSCTTAGPDGFTDLVLFFDNSAVSAALGTVTNGQVVILTLTGNLKPQFGGTAIRGQDVVVVKQ
jgi:hypothetical protein